MRSGLIFFAGICVGVLLVLGGMYLGQGLQFHQVIAPTSIFSQQELAELRALHAHLSVLLKAADQPVYSIRRPIVRSVRLARTNLVVALPEPASARLKLTQVNQPSPDLLALKIKPGTFAPQAPKAEHPKQTITAPVLATKALPVPMATPPKNKTTSVRPVQAKTKKTTVVKQSFSPDQLYAQALKDYQQGRHLQSREQFTRFFREFPKHKLVPNALYWTGETWYAQGNYFEAHQTFAQVRGRFPNHAKSADALLKMAYCQSRLGNRQQARIYLDQLEVSYPKSEAWRLGRQARSQLQGTLERALRVVLHG